MKVAVIRIGNSRGVRLPKAILDQVRLGEAAELSVVNGAILLSPYDGPRAGWRERFAETAALTQEEIDWLEAPLTNEDRG